MPHCDELVTCSGRHLAAARGSSDPRCDVIGLIALLFLKFSLCLCFVSMCLAPQRLSCVSFFRLQMKFSLCLCVYDSLCDFCGLLLKKKEKEKKSPPFPFKRHGE